MGIPCVRRSVTLILFVLAGVVYAPIHAFAFDLSGVIADEEERPLAKAAVWLEQGGRVWQAETDDKGLFTLRDLDVGFTNIIAWKAGYAMNGLSDLLVAPFPLTIRLPKPGAVRLRIRNHASEPVAGTRLLNMRIEDRFFVPADLLSAHGFPVSRSDAEGVLTIPDLPADGHIQFVLSHYKHANTQVAYLPVADKIQSIVMHSGFKMRGRIGSQEGAGVANAYVSIFKLGTSGRREHAYAHSDKEGYYTVRVRPDTYYVGARHPEYASPAPQQVSIQTETNANIANLTLLPPYELRGSIVGPGGRPCPGIQLAYWIRNNIYLEMTTRSDGTFRMIVPKGAGEIRISPPAGFMTEELPEIAVQTGEQAHARISPIKILPLPEIHGIVCLRNGSPADKVMLSSLDVLPPVWAITNDKGEFSMRLGSMPEKPKATFRAEHALRFLRKNFTVKVRQPTPYEVTLKPYRADASAEPQWPKKSGLTSLLGKKAPAITCATWFNTEPMSLETLRGKVVVLTFWAGFDQRPESLDRFDQLRALHNLFEGTPDVCFIAIHDGSAPTETVETYIEQLDIAFPVGCDTATFQTFTQYRIEKIPQTLLIDKRGNLYYPHQDARTLELIKVLRRDAR